MAESVYTKIIKGELPSHKVYEDDQVLAFMDINPVQPGHVLVIPKQEIEFVWDMPEDLYVEVMLVAQKIALKMRSVLPVKYIHERIVGTDVPHAHVQLIPFNNPAELGNEPDPSTEPDHEALEAMAERLRI